jgi:hypothetical protein
MRYSLIKPPRTCVLSIRAVTGSGASAAVSGPKPWLYSSRVPFQRPCEMPADWRCRPLGRCRVGEGQCRRSSQQDRAYLCFECSHGNLHVVDRRPVRQVRSADAVVRA